MNKKKQTAANAEKTVGLTPATSESVAEASVQSPKGANDVEAGFASRRFKHLNKIVPDGESETADKAERRKDELPDDLDKVVDRVCTDGEAPKTKVGANTKKSGQVAQSTETGIVLYLGDNGLPAVVQPTEIEPDDQTPLSAAEVKDFVEREAIVRRGLNTYIDVGKALSVIKARRYYREKFRTFDKYCLATFSLTAVHANRMLAAAKTVAELEEAGAPVPATESQARELAGLTKQEKVKVMTQAKAKAGKKAVTAKVIKKAKGQVLGGKESDEAQTDVEQLTPLSTILRMVQRTKTLLGPEEEFDEVHDLLQQIETALAPHAAKAVEVE